MLQNTGTEETIHNQFAVITVPLEGSSFQVWGPVAIHPAKMAALQPSSWGGVVSARGQGRTKAHM